MADQLNPAEYAELQRRFPRAGYWFGMLPTHPNIQPFLNPGNAPAAYPAPPGPPPGYTPPVGPPPRYEAAPHLSQSSSACSENLVCLPSSTHTQQRLNQVLTQAISLFGIVSRSMLRIPTDISFDDCFSRFCARMELELLEALLGYKFNGDRVRDPPFCLASEQDLRSAMTKGIEKLKRAQTREIVMEIHNLVSRSHQQLPK